MSLKSDTTMALDAASIDIDADDEVSVKFDGNVLVKGTKLVEN